MSFNRNENKKSSFDLSKFYQDLNRVQNSLGKTAPRKTASSATKNVINNQTYSRVQNLQSFKKEITNKNLVKSKIHLQKTDNKSKVNKTENEDKKNQSRIYRLSQLERTEQDPLENVRDKLGMWNSFGKITKGRRTDDYQSSYCKTTNNSKFFYANKTDNVDQQLEASTEIPIQNNQKQSNLSQILNKKLFLQLQKRDRVYKQVENEIKIQKSYYKKQYNDLSLRLKQNFRQCQLMKEIIERFKQISGLQMEDLGKLYQLLKSNSSFCRQEDRSYSRDSSILGRK